MTYTESYNAYINLFLANSSLVINLFLILSFHSRPLFGVVLHQVVSHELNGVLRSFFGNFRHGLQQQRDHSLVEVLTYRQVALILLSLVYNKQLNVSRSLTHQ